MSTMTELTKGQQAAKSLLDQARSTDPDWALTRDYPADIDVRDRYVYVELSGGGPATHLLAEYDDAEDAAQWFESEPRGAWFTYLEWGSREDVRLDSFDTALVMQAITRDPDEMDEESSS